MEYIDVLNKYGEYTGEVASRDEIHSQGLWHKAVVVFIVDSKNQKVLLQKRSANKKMWPNLWDITSGGHVLTGELGTTCALRETKEELGLDFIPRDLEFIGATSSEVIKDKIIDRHYNEYYIIHKDVDIKSITLQEEEVSDIKWVTKEELTKKVNNNFADLTTKIGCWNYLIKYFELTE